MQLAVTLPPATTLVGDTVAPCKVRSGSTVGTVVTQPMVAAKPFICTTPSEVSRTVSAPEAEVPYTVPGWLPELYAPISGEFTVVPS